MIEKRGKTRATHYILAKGYYEICGQNAQYTQMDDWNIERALPIIIDYFKSFKTAKMKDFATLFEAHLTRRQVRSLIDKMIPTYLSKKGTGSGTTYSLSEQFMANTNLLTKALGIGLEEMVKRGDIEVNVQNNVQK